MNAQFLERTFHFLAGVGWMMGLVWIGLCIFTVALLILMYTRWGQSHPLEKCMALSVLAHILLMGYATTISLAMPTPFSSEPVFQIAIEEGANDEKSATVPSGSPGESAEKSGQSWEVSLPDAVVKPEHKELDRSPTDSPAPERVVRAEAGKLPSGAALEKTGTVKTTVPEPKFSAFDDPLLPGTPTELVAPPIDVPRAGNREEINPALASSLSALPSAPDANAWSSGDSPLEPTRTSGNGIDDIPQALLQPAVSAPRVASSALPEPGGLLGKASASKNLGSRAESERAGAVIPEIYKLRVSPNRSDVTQHHGGSPETEKAVQAALQWLAENQSPDGRWKAADHGAGRDDKVLGRERKDAGSQADTGVTGLALLAFLASGNTHEQGEYKANVRRGLEYLLHTQASDGNLGGSAAIYEFMYCHAMASFAMSEAFGMTRDARLREPVERAIRYTVAAQDPKGGGWRYRPRDPGDTSQLGWQLMALKSAELAGIPIPEATRRGITRFLQNVSSGRSGGLAAYRSGEPASRPMTAEALVCWQFLGLAREHPACNEAGDFLLAELPGQGEKPNDYYWYYGTLAMYQLQGDYWQRWNEALQKTLLERQIKEGPSAGAWEADTVWGGYGGRIYTTAIAALSLEVYYRFLPLYADGKTVVGQSK